jgi:hypothetical protein
MVHRPFERVLSVGYTRTGCLPGDLSAQDVSVPARTLIAGGAMETDPDASQAGPFRR